MTATPTTRPTADRVSLRQIKINVVKIEKTLKSNILYQIAEQLKDDKKKRKLRLIQQEDKLEKRKSPGILKKIQQKAAIRTGFFDSLLNFISWTFLGFVYSRIETFLPKLVGIIGLLKPAGAFIGWMTQFFVDSFASFISAGYFVYDSIKSKTSSIKKEPIDSTFTSFTGALKNVLKSTVNIAYSIAGLEIPKFETQQETPKVKAAATGAYIGPTRGTTPTNKPVSRRLRQVKKPLVLSKQKVSEKPISKEIRQFYRSPKTTSYQKTPVDSIFNVSRTLRQKTGLFTDISAVGTDIALGNKPSKTVYYNTAKDVVMLAHMINNNYENRTKDNVIGMMNGGKIDPGIRKVANNVNLVDLIAVMIQRSVEERTNKAIFEVKQYMIREKKEFERVTGTIGNSGGVSPDGQFYGPGGAGGAGYGEHTSDYGEIKKIEMSGFSTDDIVVLGKIIQAEAGGENDLGKAAVMNVILNRYRLIKSKKASPSQFGVTGKRAEDVRIWDIVSAGGGKEFSPIRDGSYYRVPPEMGLRALEKAIKAGGNDPEVLKKNLEKSGKTKQESDYTVRSVGFYNPETSTSNPFGTATVRVGRHGFQQSRDVKLTGRIGKVGAIISEIGNVSLPPGEYSKVVNEISSAEQLFLNPGQRKGKIAAHREVGFTSGFGMRGDRMHKGADIGTSKQKGYKVGFKKSGRVVTVNYDEGGWGNYVIIRDQKGNDYLFAHLANIDTKIVPGAAYGGEGQLIGEIGSTGRSTGEHLHFEKHLLGRDKSRTTVNPINDLGLLVIGKKSIKFQQNPTVVSPNSSPSQKVAFIELHADEARGRTGLIESLIDPENPLIKALGTAYGKFPKGYRDLGGPKRGLSLLELVTLNSQNTQNLLNPETRSDFIEKEAKRLFGILKKHPDVQVRLFAGHSDLTRGQTGTSGTSRGRTIEGKTLEQFFNTSVAAKIAELAKKEKLTNIQYISSRIANEDSDPNNNWNRAKTMRIALLKALNLNPTPAEKNRQKLEDKAKTRKYRWEKSTLINPSIEEINKRISNLSVTPVFMGKQIGESRTFDVVHQGSRFTIKRFSPTKVEVYDSTGKKVDNKFFTAAVKAKKPYLDPRKRPSAPKLPPSPAERQKKQQQIIKPTKGTKPKTKSQSQKTRPARPQRAWYDPRGWIGKKKGGIIGNIKSSIPSGYAPYEQNQGSFVLAIQPMVIQQPIPLESHIAVPFPVSNNVNNSLPNRA